MDKNYYYSDLAEQVHGPLTLPELDAMHKAGKIASNTQVCEEGTENWTQFYLLSRPTPPIQKVIKKEEEKPKEVVKSEPKQKRQEFQGITKGQGSALIAILLVGIGAPFWVFLKPVPQWEYNIVAPSDTMFVSEMDRYGKEGWELVSARRAVDDGEGAYECILKRPKR